MIFNIIAYACLSVIFAKSSITGKIKYIFNIDELATPDNYFLQLLQELVNCCMCSGFWIGLICTQSVLMAAIISILAEYIGEKLL